MPEQLLLPSGENKSIENSILLKNEKKGAKSMFMTGSEILAYKNVHEKFLVEPILPCGTVCFLAGPSDTGKSILSRQIAVAVALGKTSVLGMPLKLKHQRAIVISTEDDRTDWKEKLTLYSLPIAEKGLENLLVSFEPETCDIIQLRKCLEVNPVDIIVVDVFADIFQGNLNDVMDVRKFLKPYKKLANDFDCTILFLHHLTKSGQKSEPSKLNLVGSQGLEAIARSVLELRADPTDLDCRLLSVVKNNYISPKAKSIASKLKLNEKLEFENQGSKLIQDIGKKASHSTNEEVIKLILEEKKKGSSSRAISTKLSENGTPLGKSTVSEILKGNPLRMSDL
jgi:RecA-family ATPase